MLLWVIKKCDGDQARHCFLWQGNFSCWFAGMYPCKNQSYITCSPAIFTYSHSSTVVVGSFANLSKWIPYQFLCCILKFWKYEILDTCWLVSLQGIHWNTIKYVLQIDWKTIKFMIKRWNFWDTCSLSIAWLKILKKRQSLSRSKEKKV